MNAVVLPEEIKARIRTECILHGGLGFELKNSAFGVQFAWYDKFHAKKGLFSYKWKYDEKVLLYDKGYMKAWERALSKLPSAIKYTKKDVLVGDDVTTRKPGRNYENGMKQYSVEYTLRVPASYSAAVAAAAENETAFVANFVSPGLLAKAQKFKEKVTKDHEVVLSACYHKGYKKGCNSISEESFSNRDNIVIYFASLGLKPLAKEEQRLGLALALAEYTAWNEKDDFSRFFVTHTADQDTITCMNLRQELPKKNLKNW